MSFETKEIFEHTYEINSHDIHTFHHDPTAVPGNLMNLGDFIVVSVEPGVWEFTQHGVCSSVLAFNGTSNDLFDFSMIDITNYTTKWHFMLGGGIVTIPGAPTPFVIDWQTFQPETNQPFFTETDFQKFQIAGSLRERPVPQLEEIGPIYMEFTFPFVKHLLFRHDSYQPGVKFVNNWRITAKRIGAA